jgi:hypothetical protein
MAQFVADSVAPRGITVVPAVRSIEIGVVQLPSDGFDVVAPIVEVELRQSQPPFLGAVSPAADLNPAFVWPALLWICPTPHLVQGDGVGQIQLEIALRK